MLEFNILLMKFSTLFCSKFRLMIKRKDFEKLILQIFKKLNKFVSLRLNKKIIKQ